jgi:hypothetical protein
MPWIRASKHALGREITTAAGSPPFLLFLCACRGRSAHGKQGVTRGTRGLDFSVFIQARERGKLLFTKKKERGKLYNVRYLRMHGTRFPFRLGKSSSTFRTNNFFLKFDQFYLSTILHLYLQKNYYRYIYTLYN